MTGKNMARFAVAIIASWMAMWLGRNRIPDSLTQGLAFWLMFLILPVKVSDEAEGKNPSSARHILAATAGGAVVLILNMLVGGW